MAKDLPYFKFFCSEWSDGDITLEDLHVQGLFINLCAYYWSNECNITLTKARKKFRFCKDNSFDLYDVLKKTDKWFSEKHHTDQNYYLFLFLLIFYLLHPCIDSISH